jgi:hypothetical protein
MKRLSAMPSTKFGYLVGFLLLVSLACNFPTANPRIDNVYLAKDFEGKQAVQIFTPDEIIFGIVELVESPMETNIRAVWIASDTDAIESNFQIYEAEIVTSSGIVHFELSNDLPWPKGTYRLDIYLNGELERILEFDVQ